jgi:stearoyl-CoA desaturase (delta-9 desaturase)
MVNDVLSLLSRGIAPLPWWGYVVVTLAFTHVTIAAVTIYLHRSQSHRALDLHPAVAHVFRFWLWLTTGMVTKEWVAIHRKHHAKVETADDPHSPVAHGIKTVFWKGSELYRAEAKNAETLAKYGHGTPDDWLERNLYARFSWQGVGVMMIIDLTLFGAVGLTIWAVQMLWIPVTAAGIINGIGHYWGYRSYACADASTNIVPWGVLIGGEELHNNHHAYATSAKLSSKWFEFDIGWAYIRILAALRLAQVRKVAPKLVKAPAKPAPDLATLQAIITHRYHVATDYARALKTACAAELAALRARNTRAKVPSTRRIKRLLSNGPSGWSPTELEHVESTVAQSHVLAKIVAMRSELAALWERSTESSEQLLVKLQDWCHRAESSGIPPLARFSHKLRRYA